MSDTPQKPTLPMFTITSDPLPMQPEMFTALGEAVIHWSRIESTLDDEIEEMRKWGIVRKLAKHVPHTFSKKLELWRRSVRTLYRSIDEYQSYADEVELQIKKVAKIRNHLIHGLWTLAENENGEFLVSNYRSVGGIERHDTLWVGQKELDDLLHDVKVLSGALMGFKVTKMIHGGQGLLRATPPPSPDHQARSIPATDETPQPPPQSSAV